MILYSIIVLLTIGSINAKSVPKKECDESKTHFFVIDNASLQSSDPIVYKSTSEEECLKTCTQNRDKFNRPITCNSFTYDHASFSCTIHQEKSTPVGSASVETSIGKRYFEKTCISHSLPEQCAQSQFIRVDQSVLVGYAVNMTLTDTIESCVAQCVQDAGCKSAMYFYEDGECITNKESALSKPAGFTKEETDKVIYFQNGCDLNAEKKSPINSEISEVPVDDTPVVTDVKPVAHIQISETTPKPSLAMNVEQVSEKLEHNKEEKQDEQNEEKQEETNAETEDDGEYEDDGEEVTEETVEEEVPSTTPKATTTTTVTVEETTTETATPKRIKNLIQKKIKKHPKNFGSKTYEILKKQETVKRSKFEKPETEENFEITSEDSSKSAEDASDLEETYFSDWSDWTPCTKSNERQVRRRRCLNLRKCLGALMQVQNCPEIIPTTTPQSNEMVRSVVSVDGDEYDEPIAVDNISVDAAPSRLLPVLNEQVWGKWQGACQQFASSQPCNNGSMIGFESRECIAKDPAQCEGPFFRYCTLSC